MGLFEKFEVLNALLWEDDDDDPEDIESLLEDSDMLTKVLEEARDVAPKAGSVLIDEELDYMANRLSMLSERGGYSQWSERAILWELKGHGTLRKIRISRR